MRPPSISSLDSLLGLASSSAHILCLYSGGLDGTYLLSRLATRDHRVTALTVDIGGDLDISAIEGVCSHLGIRSLVVDRREQFAHKYVLPSIVANARYLGGHPICASLSRPLIAETACAIARQIGCDIIIHTSSSSQNSLRRFNGAIASLGFPGLFGSPFEETFLPRSEKREELTRRGIPYTTRPLYSVDSNLWGREFEHQDLDDPEFIQVPETLYHWTRSHSPEPNLTIEISFRGGAPFKLGDREVDFLYLINKLNETAGAYGLGRFEGLEEIQGGHKVQEVREMPAAFVLLDAYRRLESCCLSGECIREKMHIEQIWVREAVEGRWFEPLRLAAQAFLESVAEEVTGSIVYELKRHLLLLRSLKAAKPLYVRNRDLLERNSSK